MFFIWICTPFHVEFRPESSLCLDCGYFFQSLLRWTSGQIMQVKTVSKFSSGGGRDALACTISGHPFHVSSRKCLETPNFALFTMWTLRRNLETYLTVSNSAGNQDTSAGQISDFSCRALVRKHLETPIFSPSTHPLSTTAPGSRPFDVLLIWKCISLRWRHNEWDSVSNHQPHDCLLNRLSGHRSKKTSKPRVTGLWTGNSPETGEFPAQMTSHAATVSIWWRHHVST